MPNHRTPDHEIARLRAEVELLAAQMAAMRAEITAAAHSLAEIDDTAALVERHVTQLVEKLTQP